MTARVALAQGNHKVDPWAGDHRGVARRPQTGLGMVPRGDARARQTADAERIAASMQDKGQVARPWRERTSKLVSWLIIPSATLINCQLLYQSVSQQLGPSVRKLVT